MSEVVAGINVPDLVVGVKPGVVAGFNAIDVVARFNAIEVVAGLKFNAIEVVAVFKVPASVSATMGVSSL